MCIRMYVQMNMYLSSMYVCIYLFVSLSNYVCAGYTHKLVLTSVMLMISPSINQPLYSPIHILCSHLPTYLPMYLSQLASYLSNCDYPPTYAYMYCVTKCKCMLTWC